MTIFGIGPLELLLILILGLLVFGPERLPEVGRFLGKQLARLMAWQQQSPEAQMIQQMRSEFEREILELRDELVRTRQQANVLTDVQKLGEETRTLLSLKTPVGTVVAGETRVTPAGGDAGGAPVIGGAPPSEGPRVPSESYLRRRQFLEDEALHTLPDPADSAAQTAYGVDGSSQAAAPAGDGARNGEWRAALPEETLTIAPAPGAGVVEHELLLLQVQALMADVHALQEQLRARGLLDPDWQPPSHAMRHETVS